MKKRWQERAADRRDNRGDRPSFGKPLTIPFLKIDEQKNIADAESYQQSLCDFKTMRFLKKNATQIVTLESPDFCKATFDFWS